MSVKMLCYWMSHEVWRIFWPLFFLSATCCVAQNTDPSGTYSIPDLPAYSSQRVCAQGCMGPCYAFGSVCDNLPGILQCPAPYYNSCFCRTDLSSSATSWISQCVFSGCNFDNADVQTALELYSSYCGVEAPVSAIASTTGGTSTATAAGTTTSTFAGMTTSTLARTTISTLIGVAPSSLAGMTTGTLARTTSSTLVGVTGNSLAGTITSTFTGMTTIILAGTISGTFVGTTTSVTGSPTGANGAGTPGFASAGAIAGYAIAGLVIAVIGLYFTWENTRSRRKKGGY